jgi:alpha-ribazole phosphatase
MQRDDENGERGCRVILVRHAIARGDGRFLGQQDARLATAGRRQLPELIGKLERYAIDAIYCSDLSRTRATAAAVARRSGLVPENRPNLREMHFGEWEGLSWSQVDERFPRLARRWLTERHPPLIPGGESFADFKRRVLLELRRLVTANPTRCIVVVTHAGVIRIALGKALGIKAEHLSRVAQSPCAVNVVDYFHGGVIVRCVNL